MAGIQADITAAEDRAAALRQEMRDKLAGQTDLTEQTKHLAQPVSDKKADQAALSAEKDSVLRSVEDLRGLQADMVSDRAERDRRVQAYRQANEKALADMAGHQAALAEKNDRAAQLRMFGRGWYTLVHSVVEPGQSIGEQLAARGIRPQDLDYVLFSHLDPDHIAGISEVRGAKRLLVAEEEYFWSCRVNLRYYRADLTPQAVAAETAQACLDVLNRLQAAGCDALGLGRKAIWSAWSMSDWRDSDFPAQLQNLRCTVEVRSEPAA